MVSILMKKKKNKNSINFIVLQNFSTDTMLHVYHNYADRNFFFVVAAVGAFLTYIFLGIKIFSIN